jgi:uncharacterized protein
VLRSDFWQRVAAFAAAGVLAGFYFGLTGTLWAVTGEFTRWGGEFLQLVGVDPHDWAYYRIIGLHGPPWTRTDGLLVFAMLAGSLAAALAGSSVRWRMPAQRRRWVLGFAGGAISGFGTRLAMGCNLAALFTGLPQFSLHAWLFIIATAAGTYVAVKLTEGAWFHGESCTCDCACDVEIAPRAQPRRSRQPILAAFVLAAILLGALAELLAGHALFAAVVLFGGAFGVIIQRAQLCFTSSLRDLWRFGKGLEAKAILLGMALQSVIVAVFIVRGTPAIIHWASLGTLIGGFLFGIGIIVAGGCETGWMYRIMEGQVHFVTVAVGNITGATILAYGWDHWGIAAALVTRWPNVNLVTVLGMPGAFAATAAFLALLYALIVVRERRCAGG